MGKNLEPGSGMNIPDLIFENMVSVIFFDTDPDAGWKKLDA
jgi:hypothetical protein